MAERELIMAGERNDKGDQPADHVGQQGRNVENGHAQDSRQPMCQRGADAYDYEAGKLSYQRWHKRNFRSAGLIETESKHIVICADDFGMDSAIDDAILQLGQQGRLNAASCLTQGASFAGGADALRRSTLSCGLHLNFTEMPVGDGGICMPVGRLIRQAWLRRLDPVAVRAQIVLQLDHFETHMRRAPDFVDGHQHVHQFPVIRDALLQILAQRYGERRPWLRSTVAGSLSGLPWSMRYKAHLISALGAHRLRRMARSGSYAQNRRFLGVYDFKGGVSSYSRLMRQWLSLAESGDLIMCHPAVRAVPGDVLGAQRRAEYELLAGQSMSDWMAQQAVALATPYSPGRR